MTRWPFPSKIILKWVGRHLGLSNVEPTLPPWSQISLMSSCNTIDELVDMEQYWNMIGSLQPLARQSIPDIMLSVNILAQFSSKPIQYLLKCVQRIYDYLKLTKRIYFTVPLTRQAGWYSNFPLRLRLWRGLKWQKVKIRVDGIYIWFYLLVELWKADVRCTFYARSRIHRRVWSLLGCQVDLNAISKIGFYTRPAVIAVLR